MSAIRITSIRNMTIANGAAVSGVIDMRFFSGMTVHMPAAWTAASIGFQVCDTADGTFLPLYDKSAAIVEIDGPAVDIAYAAPAEIFASLYVKLWSQDGAAADTNQGAERALIVTLKA